jgi:hypothetical protein
MPFPNVGPRGPEYRYDATPGAEPAFEFLGEDRLLVSGICVDTVRQIGEPYMDPGPDPEVLYKTLLSWRKIALGQNFENESHPYPCLVGEGSLLTAFKRTITADKDKYGEKIKAENNLFDPIACYHIYFDDTDTVIECEEFSIFLRYSQDQDPSFGHAERAVYLRTQRRRFFVTDKGFFGLGTPNSAIGDKVVVLPGCSVPLLLRRMQSDLITDLETAATPAQEKYTEECWSFVGECFVTGLMDGELFKKGEKFDERFLLR